MHPLLTCFLRSSLCLKLSALSLLLSLFLTGCGSLDSSSSTHTSTPVTSTIAVEGKIEPIFALIRCSRARGIWLNTSARRYRENLTPTTIDQTASGTSTPTAAPTQSGTPPKGNVTPAPVPFKVTGVSFGTWPDDHQGVCRSNTFFTASVFIYAPAHHTGGTVTYTWLRSDTGTISPVTVTFAAGTTSSMVTATWFLSAYQGNGSAYWVAFKTLAP